MKCKECDKQLKGRQKYFCSNSCKSKPLGRKNGGLYNQRVKLTCQFCDTTYERPPSQAKSSRHCSLLCHNRATAKEIDRTGENNPGWKGGIQTYRKFKKNNCERCGTTDKLIVHHKDENRYNNVLDNLETLCRRCHQIHHRCWENLPNPSSGQRQPSLP